MKMSSSRPRMAWLRVTKMTGPDGSPKYTPSTTE